MGILLRYLDTILNENRKWRKEMSAKTDQLLANCAEVVKKIGDLEAQIGTLPQENADLKQQLATLKSQFDEEDKAIDGANNTLGPVVG